MKPGGVDDAAKAPAWRHSGCVTGKLPAEYQPPQNTNPRYNQCTNPRLQYQRVRVVGQHWHLPCTESCELHDGGRGYPPHSMAAHDQGSALKALCRLVHM